MADVLSEFRDSLQRLAERTFGEMVSTSGLEPAGAVATPNNPLGAAVDVVAPDEFGTGYNGSVTTLPAIFNLSDFNDGSVFTGS